MKDTIKIGGIELVKINSTDPLTPTTPSKIELPADDKKALALAVKDNLSCLLIGETGTGKTSAVRQLAYDLQQPYSRVNMTGFTTPDELIGSKSVKDGATYYEHGVITDAMTRGSILVLDEINATTPDCLFVIHSLLDNDRRITMPNGDIIEPHPNFRVFATCNPDYEGTKSMNKAFLDRFPIILFIDTLAPAKEIALIIKREGVDEELAKKLVMIASMARKDYLEGKISTYVSTRSLLSLAHLIKSGLEPKTAFISGIARKASGKEEQAILTDFFLSVFKMPQVENGSKPVITTEAEIEGQKERIRQYQDLLSQSRDQFTDLQNKYSSLESLVEGTKMERDSLTLEKKGLLEKLENAEKELSSYKNLENIIKSVASKI